MEKVLLGLGIFFTIVIIIQLIIYAKENMSSTQRKKIKKRLRRHVYAEANSAIDSDIIKSRVYSDIKVLNQLIKSIPGIQKLDNLVIQANVGVSSGIYILASLVIVLAGLFITNALIRYLPLGIL